MSTVILEPTSELITSDPVKQISIHMGLISVYSSKNVGVRAISASLRDAGIKSETIFFKDLIGSDSPFPTAREYDLLVDLVRQLKVNMVGLSIICSSCNNIAAKITQKIKKELGPPSCRSASTSARESSELEMRTSYLSDAG